MMEGGTGSLGFDLGKFSIFEAVNCLIQSDWFFLPTAEGNKSVM